MPACDVEALGSLAASKIPLVIFDAGRLGIRPGSNCPLVILLAGKFPIRSGGNCPVIISCAECWCGPTGKVVGLSGMSFHDGHWSDLLVLATNALPTPWTPLLAIA